MDAMEFIPLKIGEDDMDAMEFIPLKIGESDIPPAPPVYLHIIFHHTALSTLLYPKATPSGGKIPLREVNTQKNAHQLHGFHAAHG